MLCLNNLAQIEEMEEIARDNVGLVKLCLELHPPKLYAQSTEGLAETLFGISPSLEMIVLWGPSVFSRQYRRGVKVLKDVSFDFDEWGGWNR